MKSGVICIGGTMVDAYAFVDDSLLEKYQIKKGEAPVLPINQVEEIVKELSFISRCCGGSAANVSRGLGMLGSKVALYGQYGDDEDGEIIKTSLKKYRITDISSVKKGARTTVINTLITEDAQRTMIISPAASHEEHVTKLSHETIDQYEYMLVEGYHMGCEILRNLSFEAVDYAYSKGLKIIFMLSNTFYVNKNREHMQKIVDKASIILGNEDEFMAMFQKSTIDEVIDDLISKYKYDLSIVTLGEKGACIINKGKKYMLKPPTITKIIDTTGAGDFFAAGILYGYMNGYSMELCGKIANTFAGNVISHVGVNIDEEIKDEIKKLIADEKK